VSPVGNGLLGLLFQADPAISRGRSGGPTQRAFWGGDCFLPDSEHGIELKQNYSSGRE
jgi:hypothetical protein